MIPIRKLKKHELKDLRIRFEGLYRKYVGGMERVKEALELTSEEWRRLCVLNPTLAQMPEEIDKKWEEDIQAILYCKALGKPLPEHLRANEKFLNITAAKHFHNKSREQKRRRKKNKEAVTQGEGDIGFNIDINKKLARDEKKKLKAGNYRIP